MRDNRKRRHFLGRFLGLSILFHLHVALLVAAMMALDPGGCATADPTMAPVEVALVPRDEIRTEELDVEELEEEKEEEEKEEREEKGQVVDIAPPDEEKRPEEARFLSEHDSRVKKETKAPPVPYKPGKVLSDRPVRQERARPPSPKEREQIERKAMKLAMRSKPDLPKSQLEESEQGDEPARTEASSEEAPRGPPQVESPDAAPKKKVTMKDLELSDKELSKAVGTRAPDHLEGVEEGERTLLNSKRWRFASFFNRVKRQVAQNWHPDVAYRRRDPSGNVYGFKDRLTILRVRLSPSGALKDLHLEKASGVGFLDDEAMAAFRAAQPFPNPPEGLVDEETGMISFRFGFLFEISRRPNFRIFRFR